MPMIPETAFAMLACARIGAIHSVVFGGFSPESLKDRILDADCSIVITADEGVRGGKKVPLKANVDEALKACPGVKNTLVIKRTGGEISWHENKDLWYEDLACEADTNCEPEPMDSEDPLFFFTPLVLQENPKEFFIQLQDTYWAHILASNIYLV